MNKLLETWRSLSKEEQQQVIIDINLGSRYIMDKEPKAHRTAILLLQELAKHEKKT